MNQTNRMAAEVPVKTRTRSRLLLRGSWNTTGKFDQVIHPLIENHKYASNSVNYVRNTDPYKTVKISGY